MRLQLKKAHLSYLICPILSNFLALWKRSACSISKHCNISCMKFGLTRNSPSLQPLFSVYAYSNILSPKKWVYFPELTINTSSTALLKPLVAPLTPNDPWFIQTLSKMYILLFVPPSLDWDSNRSSSYTKYSKISKLSQNHSIVQFLKERDKIARTRQEHWNASTAPQSSGIFCVRVIYYRSELAISTTPSTSV